jgi:DNA-binding transcriptional regulator YbjK
MLYGYAIGFFKIIKEIRVILMQIALERINKITVDAFMLRMIASAALMILSSLICFYFSILDTVFIKFFLPNINLDFE